MTQSAMDFYRNAIAELLESLDASVHVSTLASPQAAPEETRACASRLVERLGTANRLAKGRFTGPERVVTKMSAMSAAVQRLDEAFVSYRRSEGGSREERARGAEALQVEIDKVRGHLKLSA